MRAELNRSLQACKTVDDATACGLSFQEKYGDSVWGCTTIYTHETFADLYNAHLSRCVEDDLQREADAERAKTVRQEISNCGNLNQFEDVKAFVERFFSDDAQVLFELGEKGQELGHPDYLDDGGMP